VKTCEVCRAANEPEAAFCGTCGSPLPASAPAGETATPTSSEPEVVVETSAQEAVDQEAADDTVTPTTKSKVKSKASGGDGGAVADSSGAGTVTPTPVPTPWATGKTAPPAGIICPVCQTENEADREFCKKCASPLNPTEVVKPRLVTRGFVARFLLSFVIGVAVPVGAAAGFNAVANAPKELPATPISLILQGGEPLEFEIVPTSDEAAPIVPLPPETTVQLASAKEVIDSTPPGQNIDAKWWNDGIPRVPAVSQFDGGPQQKVNCTLAAGAMLARLAFGIVTTGSQLRLLQDKKDGGTNFEDLNKALDRGWGVTFLRGSLTALQLRALSYAGAGITVSLDYGEVPLGVRLQASFTGGHAVYIDAFTENGPDGKPAYWVMDPIGHSWAGYKGGWWPAEDVERAALARNGGWISAAWAFAGGRIPDPRPKLPVQAYPGAEPGQPTPPVIGPPIEDPMPVLPPPVRSDPDTGTPPPETPVWPTVDWNQKVFELDPGTSFAKCAIVPAPSYCPIGIIGIVSIPGTPIATRPPLRDDIKLLYADALAPGTYQVIFETPPDTWGSLFLWSGTAGELKEATVDQGVIDGRTVQIATIAIDPNVGFSFFTTATGDGYRAVSEVGSLTIKQ